jgi:predicted TIM-barrel fold metal-dependent hydrolase
VVTQLYDGPVIDAHTHLWDLAHDKYPWLTPNGSFGPKGRFDALKGKNYLLKDYKRDIEGCDVIASVHVEALWDPADDRVNETRWLETLDKSHNLACRYVVGVDFGTPATESQLREHAQFERVKSVRQTIAWTPNPDRSMAAEADITHKPDWRAAIPVLIELGFSLDLLIYPYQSENVAELSADFPELQIIVNHIGSPIEQDDAGLKRWHDGVQLMGQQPNVLMKLSAVASYVSIKDIEHMRPFVTHIIDCFGADRVMVGSDFPVAKLVGWSYRQYINAYKQCVSDHARAEQEQIFWRTAAHAYSIPVEL